MSESSKGGAGWGLALAVVLHAFIVELGVAWHGALAPVLWGLLLGVLALDALDVRSHGIALAGFNQLKAQFLNLKRHRESPAWFGLAGLRAITSPPAARADAVEAASAASTGAAG